MYTHTFAHKHRIPVTVMTHSQQPGIELLSNHSVVTRYLVSLSTAV